LAATTTPPLDPELVERKRRLAFARFKYGAAHGGTLLVLLLICMPLTSEAVRSLLPSFGTKLSKTAIIGPLFSGPSMAKLDVAYVTAAVIYVVVLFFWRELLSLWLDPDAATDFHEGPYKAVVTLGGILILLIDGCLMYVAIASLNWGKITFSFVALLFTLTYLVGLVYASLVSMQLKKAIKKLEDEV
jgi:hypothetical protein